MRGRPEWLLCEVVLCGTIPSGDDCNDFVDWGNAHLPCADGLRRKRLFDRLKAAISATD